MNKVIENYQPTDWGYETPMLSDEGNKEQHGYQKSKLLEIVKDNAVIHEIRDLVTPSADMTMKLFDNVIASCVTTSGDDIKAIREENKFVTNVESEYDVTCEQVQLKNDIEVDSFRDSLKDIVNAHYFDGRRYNVSGNEMEYNKEQIIAKLEDSDVTKEVLSWIYNELLSADNRDAKLIYFDYLNERTPSIDKLHNLIYHIIYEIVRDRD